MRANETTFLIGSKILLVPYTLEHVPVCIPKSSFFALSSLHLHILHLLAQGHKLTVYIGIQQKYHAWMQCSELRELTASEELTLEQEQEMCRKWREDEDKLTFIIVARPPQSTLTPTPDDMKSYPMIGDVNIFLKGNPPWLDGGEKADEDSVEFEAEVEVMIAEKEYRRSGCAHEALVLMLGYATGCPSFSLRSPPASTASSATCSNTRPSATLPHCIPPEALTVRISQSNNASIALFEKLGFRVTKLVEVFGEIEMRWSR